LKALAAAGHDIALVVTQPDRPGHRGKVAPTPVKEAATARRLPVYQPERARDPGAVAHLRAARPELIVVAAYGQILSREILELPPLGALNVHASLLPRWRGAAPVNRAILAGDAITGVTIMRMDEEIDHGPILVARELAITAEDDAQSLTEKLAELGAELLLEVIGDVERYPPSKQDHDRATFAPRLRKEEGHLDWTLSASEIDRRVRALRPWPGTSIELNGRSVKLLRGRPLEGAAVAAPGTILGFERGAVVVATGDGRYLVEEVQLPGRRPMSPKQLVA
jgi:methionyl-tRNA formyltransferase